MQPRLVVTRRSLRSLCLIIAVGALSGGCPDDMRNQPAFTYQEAPRRHSPEGSIPQIPAFSQGISPPASNEQDSRGAHLFAINCAHCHGGEGLGDGPMAGYLPEVPTNLQVPIVQLKPDAVLYAIVTHGMNAMPAFEKFLSHDERWALVSFLRRWNDPASSSQVDSGTSRMERLPGR